MLLILFFAVVILVGALLPTRAATHTHTSARFSKTCDIRNKKKNFSQCENYLKKKKILWQKKCKSNTETKDNDCSLFHTLFLARTLATRGAHICTRSMRICVCAHVCDVRTQTPEQRQRRIHDFLYACMSARIFFLLYFIFCHFTYSQTDSHLFLFFFYVLVFSTNTTEMYKRTCVYMYICCLFFYFNFLLYSFCCCFAHNLISF